MKYMETKFAALGLEVYRQNYSATRPAVFGNQVSFHSTNNNNYSSSILTIILQEAEVTGCNVYGILRAGRSSSAESLILSAPYTLHKGASNLHGLAVMLGLADYFKSKVKQLYTSDDAYYMCFLYTRQKLLGQRYHISGHF